MGEGADRVSREVTAKVLRQVAARASHILQEFAQQQLQSSISSAVEDAPGAYVMRR